jgi:3-phosphoshikimate 1-carboxyvinyltransferase
MRSVQVPGDKSLTHRALLLAALADGVSRVRAPLDGADTRATAGALRLLGCAVPALHGDELVIRGLGLRGLQAPAAAIDCDNSGTTARLLLGVLSAYSFSAELTGDASLCSRPMRRVTAPLALMGAAFEELGAPDRLPVRVRGGSLRGIDHVSEHASAQVKSAILLAGLAAGVPVSVTEPSLSRDHTERMLAHLGVLLERTGSAGAPARVALTPAPSLDPLDFAVPGDFSSAAFVLAHATLTATQPVRVTGVGLNPGRIGFLAVLQRMGGRIEVENLRESCGEPLGDVVVQRASLAATSIAAAEIPSLIDEIPVLAALAARADGTTLITGAGELRVKESDRIHAVVANLRAIGVDAEELPDGLVVHGSPRPLAGRVRTLHDHRIAMAFGVLGAAPGTALEIDEPAVVAVSFPGFWTLLQSLSTA